MPSTNNLLIGLPQFPDDTLDPKIYSALSTVHLAVHNFAQAIELNTGVQEYPAAEQAGLGASGAVFTSNAARMYLPAFEAITAGQVVHIFNDAGTLKVRKAEAASSRWGHGIANNTAAVSALVGFSFMTGITTAIGGLTVGSQYWLSTTPGAIVNAPPANVQPIGIAVAASTLVYHIHPTYP